MTLKQTLKRSVPQNLSKTLALISFFLGLFLFYKGYEGLCTDDFMRMYMAVKWKLFPVFLQIAVWPPLFSFVYGTALHLGIDAMWTSHILGAAISGAIVYLVSKVVQELQESQKASTIASVLTASSALFVLLSTSMLSEPLYTLFFTLVLYYYVLFLKSHSEDDLHRSIFCCLIMTMTRLDAWPLAALYFVVLFAFGKNLKSRAFVFFTILFPVVWTLTIHLKFGDGLILLKQYKENSKAFHTSSPGTHFNALIEVIRYFPVAIFALGSAIVRKKIFRKHRTLFFIFLGSICFQALITLDRSNTLFAPRILIVPGILATILAAIEMQTWRKEFLFFAIALQIAHGVYFVKTYVPEYDMTYKNIGLSLLGDPSFQNLGDDRIGSDLEPHQLPIVALFSGSPEKFTSIYYDPTLKKVSLPFPNPPNSFLISSDQIASLLVKNDPRYKDSSIEGLHWIRIP